MKILKGKFYAGCKRGGITAVLGGVDEGCLMGWNCMLCSFSNVLVN